MKSSTNNSIYDNDFIKNDYSVFDDGKNQWDNGIKGNYYSDYNCSVVNKEGICNSGLSIPGGLSKDRYPIGSRRKL
jgi:nitrous oxidase accessory protein NosD